MSSRDASLFTSESVTEGHPDKICDQISDAILDDVLRQDPMGRVACETLVATGLVVLAGEITTTGYVNFSEVARKAIREIGYTEPGLGFDAESCGVVSAVGSQSPDIAQGVDTGGAGDQGLMFGFACRETPQLMPLPIMLAHALTRRLSEARRAGDLPWLRPDGKSQVTVEYVDGKPSRVQAVVVSTQHAPEVSHEEIRREVIAKIIHPVVPAAYLDERATFVGQWGLKGSRGGSGPSYEELVETEGRPRLRMWLERVATDGLLEAAVVYGYYPCVSEGNDLVVLHHAGGDGIEASGGEPGTERARFTFPRQRRDRRLCLADFFRSREEADRLGGPDVIAFQLVTMGSRVAEATADLFAANAYREYLELHGLSVQKKKKEYK